MALTGRARTIIVVNDFASVYGGASQVALGSACELSRRGHRVILFAAISPVAPMLGEHGVEVVCLDQTEVQFSTERLRAIARTVWNAEAARRMRQLLEPLAPEETIVHIHGWPKGLSSSIVPVIREHGAGIVLTLHDYFAACPNGGFFNYATQQICTLTPLSSACLRTNCGPGGYAQKLWRVTRQVAQHRAGLPDSISHFISVSDFSLSILRRYLPADAQVHDVRNPIDAERHDRVRVASNRVFSAVGRLTPVKGPLLVAAAARTSQSPVRFVGDGELRPNIEAEYPEAEITGWKTGPEVKALLNETRAIVFAPQWYETLGLVVLEAAACGVPAIVADTCAARDLVTDGVTGLWFRGGDAKDLAAKMQLLQDDELAARLGKAAWERFWADPPTLARHADQLEACYAEVLETTAAPVAVEVGAA